MKKSAEDLYGTMVIRRQRSNLLLLVLFVLSGMLAVASYTVNMRAMGWSMTGAFTHPAPVEAAGSLATPTIALYASAETARYLQTVGGSYTQLLQPWRNFFSKEKIAFKEVTHLDTLPDPAQTILVLPSVLALGDTERAAILDFRNRGGNILATSALGARDGSGGWTGYAFVKELLNVSVTGEIPPDKDERFLNLFGDLPFSQGFGPAERIWLGKVGTNPLLMEGGKTAGILSDWARTSTSDNAGAAAVLYDEFGADKKYARWVMLSFSEVAWEVQHNALHGVVSNALAWLAHKPALYKASWPAPFQAAQVIEMDTEEGFPNAGRFAAMMDNVNAPATFYVLTSLARRFPDTVKDLARGHEIAYHGDVHDGFKGQSAAVQAQRIDTMTADLSAILGNVTGVSGFRAPLESYDNITEDLLVKKGLRYHAADPNSSNARAPLFYSPGDRQNTEQALVILPRTQLDDINLLKSGDVSQDVITNTLIKDYEQVKRMGGLGFLSIHSQNFARDSAFAAAMPVFLDHVSQNRDTMWMAPSGKVAAWWRERERLTYTVKTMPSSLALAVTIRGTTPLSPVALIVTNPQAKAMLTVTPTLSNTVRPQLQPIDDVRTALLFTGMLPGNYSYSLQFTPR